VKLAVLFAGVAIATGVISTFFLRDELGDGWIIIASLNVFMAIVYAALLILSYNGASWVRYAYTVLFVLGLVGLSRAGARVLLDLSVLTSLVANLLAISLWFSRPSSEWYRHAASLRRRPSDA
jgi:hypothetical protein